GYTFGTPTYTESSGTLNDGIVTIVSGTSVTVTTNNTLTRDTGTLTIEKSLTNDDGAPVPASFSVNYDCGNGLTGNVSVTTSTDPTVPGIPAGSTCTFSELAPDPIPGYTWAPASYSPSSITIGSTSGTFAITVNNTITRDTGTLTIAKGLFNPDNAP